MRKLLITGMSGFLGGSIYAKAVAKFICLGTFHTFVAPRDSPHWCKIDLTDFCSVSGLVHNFRPDIILHLAANSHLDDCESHPEQAQRINVKATAHLAHHAAQLKARFIYLSTDMVFDGEKTLYPEGAKTNPLSVYGRGKLQAEAVVKKLDNFAIVRSALIYGRPRLGGSSFSMWMENRLQRGEPVPLFVDQFRSPILVDNLADILLELCESDFIGTLHAGGTNRISRYSFGVQLCDILGYDSSLLKSISMKDQTSLAPRPRDVSLNVDKAIRILKTIILSSHEGLERMAKQDIID